MRNGYGTATGDRAMRRRYFRLSALVVAALMIGSLGMTPALAVDDVKPVDIKAQGNSVNHRATFEISFSGFARFFRMAYQRASDFTPITAPPPSAFDPGDDEVIFWLGKPGSKDDPNEVPEQSPDISDSSDPIM